MTAPVKQLREKGGQHVVVLAAPKVCHSVGCVIGLLVDLILAPLCEPS